MLPIFTRQICAKTRIFQRSFATTTTTISSASIQNITLSNKSSVAFTREGDENSNLVFVALHGGPGSHKDFKYLSQSISNTVKTPHQFIRFDLPGYGLSTKPGKLHPSSTTYAASVAEVLRLLEITDVHQKKSTVVAIGHSLGGHIAIELSTHIHVSALVLLASVACRPHNALMNERGFPLVKWLGMNVYSPIIGPLITWYLDLLYKNFFKFPKSSKKEEIAWTQARVAYLNWDRFNSQISTLESCPTILLYSLNDHLIQRERFEELASKLTKAGGIKKVVVYSEGGHNIQKVHADDIAVHVASLLEQIDR